MSSIPTRSIDIAPRKAETPPSAPTPQPSPKPTHCPAAQPLKPYKSGPLPVELEAFLESQHEPFSKPSEEYDELS